jgi:hypothetical protein
MAEVTQDAYIALRTYITSNWTTVSLRNDLDEEVLQLTVDDDKVLWTHKKETEKDLLRDENGNPIKDPLGRPIPVEVPFESNQELELTINLTGKDFTLPATISKSVILDIDGVEMSNEDFQPFTFENVGDQLIIKHKIQVPTLV